MATAIDKGLLRTQIRRNFRVARRRAVLGDDSALIHEPGRPGYVRIREITASGLSAYKTVRLRAALRLIPGASVYLGYDEDGELAVVNSDFAGLEQQGANPLLNNPPDLTDSDFLNQSQITTLLSHPVSTPTTPSTDVAVRGWKYVKNGVVHDFVGERVALAAFIPAANLHRLAGLFLKTDDTIQVVTSTPKETGDPLTLSGDVQECVTGAAAGSLPVWFWRLVGGMTSVLAEHSFLDGRQLLNISTSTSGSGAPDDASYVTTEAEAGLSNEFNLGALSSGLLKHTVAGGVSTPATATPGTDYTTPTGSENLTNKTINSSPIGGTTPAAGKFTTLEATGAVLFNDAGADVDLRAEGDTDPNLFFLDASTDRVGIGTNTPSAKLNVEGDVIINDSGADKDVRIEGDTDANLFFTDASTDRLGIGTASPVGKLHVKGTDPNVEALMVDAAAAQANPIVSIRDASLNYALIVYANSQVLGNFNNLSTADFIWNGDTIQVLQVDAGLEVVNVGNASPDASAILQAHSTAKGFLPPVMTAAQLAAIASPAEGLMGYASDSDMLHVYDAQRFRNVKSTGWAIHCYQQGMSGTANAGGSETIAANGGSLAVPIIVPCDILLESVTIRQNSTATQRTWGWDLYAQYLNNGNSGENTLARVASGNADQTFTPGAASNQTIDAASAPGAGDKPRYLGAGLYWLVIQSRHATSTLVLVNDTPNASYTMGGNFMQSKTTTNPNGSTLDFVAATWTKIARFAFCRLNGRVFGQTAAF